MKANKNDAIFSAWLHHSHASFPQILCLVTVEMHNESEIYKEQGTILKADGAAL